MNPPPLADVAARTALRAASAATITSLVDALDSALGSDRISVREAARRAASTDYAYLSPVLSATLPSRLADVVVYPRNLSELRDAVAIAYERDVPIVARGKGTGNYGQAVPLAGGIVVDLTNMDRLLDIGPGFIRAEAGATFVALEAAAQRSGQEIALMPTTIGSTLAGFLAGGAGGIGSIEHGWLWDGFTLALDVVTCPPSVQPLTVRGAQCLPYLHAYGVTGIIAAATVKLAPARQRVAVIASFGHHDDAVQAGLSLLHQEPPPRLVSLDDPQVVAAYPPDPALPHGRYSLRAVVDTSALGGVRQLITSNSGRLETAGAQAIPYISTLAFNHVTLRAKKTQPGLCHLQVSGDALVTHGSEVRGVLPSAMLHLDGLRTNTRDLVNGRHFGGLLLSEFQDTAMLYDGITRLESLGAHVVDPHTWLLSGPQLPAIQDLALTNDPKCLLNPGRIA